jgi:hypothetical protein
MKCCEYIPLSFSALKFGWFLTTCAYTTALFISAIFWIFLFDYSRGTSGVAPISAFLNIAEHLLQVGWVWNTPV